MSLTHIRKQLLDTLDYLPLHSKTLSRVSQHINSSSIGSEKLQNITHLLSEYLNDLKIGRKGRSKKCLQKLIWFTYLRWDNNYYEDSNWFARLPEHLKILVDGKVDSKSGHTKLFTYWPIKPKFSKSSIDTRTNPERSKSNIDKLISKNNGQGDFLFESSDKHVYDKHFGTIRKQLAFLRQHQLCKDDTITVLLPFEVIPGRGEHIKNLVRKRHFKKKLSMIRQLLLRTYPVLNNNNLENLTEIKDILNSADSKMRKLYVVGCQDLYIMKNDESFEKPITYW